MASWARNRGVLIGIFLALTALTVWLNWPRPPRLDLPCLAPEDVAHLTGSPEDRQRLIVHLSAMLYRNGQLAPWSELPEAARPLWCTILMETDLERGSGVLRETPRPDRWTIDDAADGYAAMGATDLAGLLRTQASTLADPARTPTPAQRSTFERRYVQLLPAAQAARLAYLHAHAEELSAR